MLPTPQVEGHPPCVFSPVSLPWLNEGDKMRHSGWEVWMCYWKILSSWPCSSSGQKQAVCKILAPICSPSWCIEQGNLGTWLWRRRTDWIIYLATRLDPCCLISSWQWWSWSFILLLLGSRIHVHLFICSKEGRRLLVLLEKKITQNWSLRTKLNDGFILFRNILFLQWH